jgi:WD40 repeat protein
MEIIKEGRKAKQYLTDIKYSTSDAELVAMASNDGRVYLHDSKGLEYMHVVETSSKTGSIRAVDFSSDSKLLRIATNLNELFFYVIETKTFVTNASQVRDVEWAKPTVPFAWNNQGN